MHPDIPSVNPSKNYEPGTWNKTRNEFLQGKGGAGPIRVPAPQIYPRRAYALSDCCVNYLSALTRHLSGSSLFAGFLFQELPAGYPLPELKEDQGPAGL